MVRESMQKVLDDLARDDKFLHPMAKPALQKRLADLGREAGLEFEGRPISFDFPEAFHSLPEEDRAAITAAIHETLVREHQRAFVWYGQKILAVAVELEAERIKRHTGR
jgi:hypothetical protein